MEEALRQAAEKAESGNSERRTRQLEYLRALTEMADLDILASDEMWR